MAVQRSKRFPVSPPYQRAAVPLGPFAVEPMDLWHMIVTDGVGWSRLDDVTAAKAAWLCGALEAAGVVVTGYDRVALHLLFPECATTAVQVVAGWIARAQRPDQAGVIRDSRRGTLDRLHLALQAADVALGDYDHDVMRYLIEDCGPPAARMVAGWLGRVGERDQQRT